MNLNLAIAYIFATLSFFFLLLYMYKNHRLENENNKLKDDYLLLAKNQGHFSPKITFIRPDEKVIYDILFNLYSEKYIIIPQARLSDLIDVKGGYRDHDNLYQLIGQKSVDYLFVQKSDMKSVLAIELNGVYHFWDSRKSKDKMKESLLSFVNIPLISIQKTEHYDTEEIKNIINNKLGNTV